LAELKDRCGRGHFIEMDFLPRRINDLSKLNSGSVIFGQNLFHEVENE
jgi:hypothetical protein